MEGEVARLILDSLDNSNTPKGTLGDVFQSYINSLKQEEEQVLNEKDKILAKKLKFLKSCEEVSDLGWFDYDSWNTFPKIMQDYFIEKVETLYYGGVFFQYSKLVDIESEFWKLLPVSHMVTVLLDSNNYHIHCSGPEDIKYNWLGENAMKSMQSKFREQTIRSIGVTDSGKIVEKLREIVNG